MGPLSGPTGDRIYVIQAEARSAPCGETSAHACGRFARGGARGWPGTRPTQPRANGCHEQSDASSDEQQVKDHLDAHDGLRSVGLGRDVTEPDASEDRGGEVEGTHMTQRLAELRRLEV